MAGEPEMDLAGPEDLQKEMEKFFEHVGRWKRPVFFFEKAWKPRCDVSETESEIVVVAEIAGMDTEKVDIEVEGDDLYISGARQDRNRSTSKHYQLMEITYGAFERVIRLPARVDAAGATAAYEDGFLEIRLPKAGKKERKEVDVDVEQ